MSFGVTPEGFVPKTLQDIKTSLEEKILAKLGVSLDLSPSEPFGQVVGVAAGELAEGWEGLEDTYHAAIPDDATGASLASLAGLTGTLQEPPKRSTGVAVLIGTTGTVAPEGRIISVLGRTDSRFLTVADATIAAVAAWVGSTVYALGNRRKNGGRVYEAIDPGTSAASGGPNGTGTAITDGGVVWRYLGQGDGAIDVAVESERFGPITAPAFTLSVIETPVAGLDKAINLEDIDPGAELETDASLRRRREEELRASGNAALEAIRARVLLVEGVTSCTVFENTTMSTNADSMPPKSVEALVLQPVGIDADQDVREALFDSVAAGIEIHGAVSGTVTDSQGTTHTVKFTRPTERRIYLAMDLTKDPDLYPADGDVQVRDLLVAYALESFRVGTNVIPSAFAAQAFRIPGVVDVVQVRVGFSSPPLSTVALPIGPRELATLNSPDVTVNSSDYSP